MKAIKVGRSNSLDAGIGDKCGSFVLMKAVEDQMFCSTDLYNSDNRSQHRTSVKQVTLMQLSIASSPMCCGRIAGKIFF